ncbi:MAG TPA: hypothetical protein VNS58_08790 [Puia sp.]|nr:hypothetical protein [Puia sp.]
MQRPSNIAMRRLMRQTLVCALMIAVVGLSFASKGGGGDKKSNNRIPLKTEFTPIRTTGTFTLKAGPSYTGSFMLGQEKTKNYISIHSLVTYEKGNSIFIVPYSYKVNTPVLMDGSRKTNLQLLDLRIKMHR